MTNAKRDKLMPNHPRYTPPDYRCVVESCNNTAAVIEDIDLSSGYTLYCAKCWMDIFAVDIIVDNKCKV